QNLGEVLGRYDRVVVPEINLGQLALLLRGRFLVDVIGYNKVRGLPFKAEQLADVLQEVLDRGQSQPQQEPERNPGQATTGSQDRHPVQGEGLQVRPGRPVVPRVW